MIRKVDRSDNLFAEVLVVTVTIFLTIFLLVFIVLHGILGVEIMKSAKEYIKYIQKHGNKLQIKK